MATCLQIDFPFDGPFGEEMAAQLDGLAHSIVSEPGFVWKIWTEDPAKREAGGIYVFDNEAAAEAYLEMHSARLQEFGISGIRAKIFAVNDTLSKITRAPAPF